MAVTKLMNIKASPKGAGRHLFYSIRYIMNPEKTENGLWVGGNSGSECHEVFNNFMDTKSEWGKMDGRQGYHFVLSWEPGETDVQTAYKMIQEFCEEYLGDNYDYVFSVHNDKKHIHGHVVFNSVNRNTGYKYRYEKGDWEKYIQPVTDRVCERHGLQKLKYDRSKKKGRSHAEYKAEKEGSFCWKKIIRSDIDYVIGCSESYADFLEQMRILGYQIKEGYSWKDKRNYVSFCAPGQSRGWKDKNLGPGYKQEEIQYRILHKSFQYDFPRPPKIRHCRMQPEAKNNRQLSRYQVRKVRELYRTSFYYARKNPYAVDQAKIRKNMLQIRRLREDCSYLLRRNIRSEESLVQREAELVEAEKILKAQQSNRYQFRNDDLLKKYWELQQELKQIPDEDDRFEEIQDEMELLENALPYNAESADLEFEKAKEELAAVRQEKRIIRHIKKMDKGMTAIEMLPQKLDTDYKKERKKGTTAAPKKGGKEIWQKR